MSASAATRNEPTLRLTPGHSASAEPLVVPPRGSVALGLDVGGTKVAAGLVDSSGVVLTRALVPTAGSGPDELWDVVAGLVATVLAETGPDTVVDRCGVGCGGPMAGFGETVSPVNIPQWREFPLRQRLVDLLGVPVALDNDAKALALAEGWLGAAAGCPNFIAMVVSTGVGGGIVLDGRLLDGADGNAGHIGHVIVEPDGRRCGCGAQGCLEAEASGTAIAAITGEPAAQASPEEVERVGTLVGRAVASVASLLDLRLAVVGGSVALGFGDPFFAAARRELSARAQLDFAANVDIVPVGLGEDAPLIGAAAVSWRAGQ